MSPATLLPSASTPSPSVCVAVKAVSQAREETLALLFSTSFFSASSGISASRCSTPVSRSSTSTPPPPPPPPPPSAPASTSASSDLDPGTPLAPEPSPGPASTSTMTEAAQQPAPKQYFKGVVKQVSRMMAGCRRDRFNFVARVTVSVTIAWLMQWHGQHEKIPFKAQALACHHIFLDLCAKDMYVG